MSELRPQAAELAAAVTERELLRLLGLPRGRALEGELRERADGARAWFAVHGRPFAAARRVEVRDLTATGVLLSDGSELSSRRLAEGLHATRGHAVLVLAVSAGREVAAEVSRAWAEDRPDEAYFLDRFATARDGSAPSCGFRRRVPHGLGAGRDAAAPALARLRRLRDRAISIG